MKAKFKPLACSFHSHSDASLDGASTVEAKIIRAAQLGRVADCLTDHGIMSGLMPHYMAAQKLAKDKKNPINIQSIHGIEAYVIDPHRPWKVYANGKTEPRYSHLTIHFKTLAAYKYFCQLSEKMEKRAILKFGEKKPLLYLEELEPIAGQITFGSSCLIGLVQKNVLRGRFEWATEMYERLRALAGPGNFFVEIFPHIVNHDWQKPKRDSKTKKILEEGKFVPKLYVEKDDIHGNPVEKGVHICSLHCTNDEHFDHGELCGGGIDIQKDPNMWVIQQAKKYGDPIVMSLDDHYASPEDKEVQNSRLSNGQESWRFYNDYCMLTSDQCAEAFKQQLGASDRDIEEWIDNSYRFVELFKDYKMETAKDRWLLPTTEMVYNTPKSSLEVLHELVEKHGRMPAVTDPSYSVYKERLDYEISVYRDNGVADFLPYLFVQEDCSSWARANDIMYNIRGSAGGSLIIYLLGISITDPIRYDLPFERMLTLGRIKSGSLPDIDSDWEDRDLVLAYLKQKYGDRFALISTDLLLKLKSSILDVERAVKGMVFESTARMCQKMKGAPQGITDKEWLYGYKDPATGADVPGFWGSEESKDLMDYSERNPEIWETVQKCIGISKTKGVHAGGIILSPRPITEDFPVIVTPKGNVVAYNMKGVEALGGIKFDFLGVSTLKAIGSSMRSIKKRTGVNIPWGEFPYDPSVMIDIIGKDKLEAIFQLNTQLVRGYIKKMSLMSIMDIAACTALIRPGALDSDSPDPRDPKPKNPDGTKNPFGVTAADYFVKCSMGEREPYYIHPDLQPILGESHGVCIAEGTKIKTSNGLSEIQNINIGDTVLTEDGSYQKVKNKIFSGKKQTLRIRTDNGEELLCTGEHLILTNTGWKKAVDLDKNDLVKSFYLTDTRKEEKGTLKDWLVGLLLADGNLCSNTLDIACSGKDFAEKVKEIADAEFGLKSKVYFHTRCWHVLLSHRNGGDGFEEHERANPIKEYCRQNNMLGKNSYTKEWPTHYNLMTIAGMIEGDGCLSNRRIRLKNKNLAWGVFSALQSYHIHSSIYYTNDGVWNVSFADYMNIIPFQIKKLKRSHIKVFVPREFFPKLPRNNKDRRYSYRKQGFISRHIADKYVNYSNKHTTWSRVLSVKNDNILPTWDLEVENIHSFVASGLVVHNCIYQEQSLRIYRDLAGYTYEMAEEVRRGIGKKDKDVLAKHGKILKDKLITERGWTEEQAEAIFQTIQASANYGFNKAHSASYSIVAYNGCYLKKHYPLDFWKGELTAHGDDNKKVSSYLKECRKYILPVDIFRSEPVEWNIEGSKLRPPLNSIKGCGAKGVINIKNFLLNEDAVLEEIEDIEEDQESDDAVG
jgi:DNA polymerase III alpha subunit